MPFPIGSTTIERAVRVRMANLGLERREDYWQQLQDSTDELQELIETVVVPETWFFRDREAFAALVRLVTEEWLPAHPSRHPALAQRSLLHRRRALFDDHGAAGWRILPGTVSGGRRGYQRAGARPSPARSLWNELVSGRESAVSVSAIFDPVEDGYALLDRLSVKVTFRQRNLLAADFHFGEEPYDVIFCRNLLIYFDRSTQEQAMRTLGSAVDAKRVPVCRSGRSVPGKLQWLCVGEPSDVFCLPKNRNQSASNRQTILSAGR